MEELYHHGIKGQKWGIRRYQNPDGTLTEEGRKRYLNSDQTLNEKGAKNYRIAKGYFHELDNKRIEYDKRLDRLRIANYYNMKNMDPKNYKSELVDLYADRISNSKYLYNKNEKEMENIIKSYNENEKLAFKVCMQYRNTPVFKLKHKINTGKEFVDDLLRRK